MFAKFVPFALEELSNSCVVGLRPADETTKTADGRNIMFELAFAAQLKLGGAEVLVVNARGHSGRTA